MIALPDDIEPALSAFMAERAMARDDAIRHILRRWLQDNGYCAPQPEETEAQPPDPDKPDPEYVQYPGYFKDGGSL